MPTILQKFAVKWCHTYLLHPEIDGAEATISQQYFWPNLSDNICNQIKVGITYHRNKKQGLKYGYLLAKEADAIPWDRLLVDHIGPYKIRGEGHGNLLKLKDLTIIEPATG